MPVQIQLSCPLAEQALAASVAAGQRVVALGREWLAAHRAVDLFMPHPAAAGCRGLSSPLELAPPKSQGKRCSPEVRGNVVVISITGNESGTGG
jgi:hypothetical protein